MRIFEQKIQSDEFKINLIDVHKLSHKKYQHDTERCENKKYKTLWTLYLKWDTIPELLREK